MKTEDHLEALLDQALEMTFPASDPFNVTVPHIVANDDDLLAADAAELPVEV